MNNEPLRPDPDRLLEQTAAPHRGKLKVFFGACAGVGKTWAMLAEAQRLRAQGLDIVVGVVETHGRKDTAAMLEGLAVLPPKRLAYRGRHISEFDLDAALARRPALILMDELAHSNAPGSRHPKRWQDIEELLEAGIDVFTTVNVQHLESLNDVVSGVTGIQVRETVPDPFFDAADDVVLVDLPPDDLRQRLKEGKVYIAGQAERAIEHFFRKGNLIALRELALRRTADRVDEQMRAWRGHPGEEKVWHTRDAILLCIGHNTGSEKLVRAAARLASRLGSVWQAVYVETPALHRLPEKKRRAILSALRLAQELGAETATLSDPAEEKAVVRYAREHNLGKIILGRPASRRWWRRETFADRLARIAPDLDQVLVALDEPPARTINNAPDSRSFKDKWRVQIQGCVVAAALCAVITLIAMQWLMAFDAANLVMLYLLGVVVVALFYGRWPSVVATVINVVSFDLFFIAPRGTLAVSDVQYLLTFAVMLTVGLVIGNLTAGVRYQARVARYREQRTRHLYEMSKALAVGRSPQDIAATSEQFIASTFHARSQVLLPDDNGKLQPLTHPQGMTPWDDAIAQWSFDKGLPAGAGTDTLPGVPYQILPLKSGEKTYGLVVVEPGNLRQLMIPEQQRLLETFTLLVANALERLTLTASEEQARMASEREQIRNALLAALSHDLRTPLTVLSLGVESLQNDDESRLSGFAQEVLRDMQHETKYMSRLIEALLTLARGDEENTPLARTKVDLTEVAVKVCNKMRPLAAKKGLGLEYSAGDAPQVFILGDKNKMEQLLIIFIDNAIKYSESGTITVTVDADSMHAVIKVMDEGIGISESDAQKIFERFYRVDKARSRAAGGFGLGLNIARIIVVRHGGTVSVKPRSPHGSIFTVRLPLYR